MRKLLVVLVLIIAACNKAELPQEEVLVYFQAAYTLPSCSQYEPDKLEIAISGNTYILNAFRIPGGIKTDPFTVSEGTYSIQDINVLNKAGDTILWTPKEYTHELVVITTPYTQKIDLDTRMLSGQLHCKN